MFGYTEERRGERAAIRDFEAQMRKLAKELTKERQPIAIDLARLPQSVRGFGHVKERNRRAAEARQERLLSEFENPLRLPSRAVA
jgi:indolepyruvate ferredoxin oxidoreductase